MTAKGHMILNIPIAASALYLAEYFEILGGLVQLEVFIFYIASMFGAVLPDIDEPESYIGRKIPVFSNILSIFIEHRGITHYAIIPLFLFAIAYFEKDFITKVVFFGIAVGVFAHTVGDMLTKGGVRGYFYPFFRSTTIALLPRFLRFYTNSITEYIFITILLSGIIYTFLFFPTLFIK